MSKQPPAPDDDPEDEWPRAPFPGFVPMDDRMSDMKHTRQKVKELADQIKENLSRHTWGPNRPLRYAA